MKMTKTKLRDIYKLCLKKIEKKETKLIHELRKTYNIKMSEAVKEYNKRVVKVLPSLIKPENIRGKPMQNWKGTDFWVEIKLNKEIYDYLNEPFENVERWKEEQTEKIDEDIRYLREKLSNWYDKTYENIIFSDPIELPDWIKTLLNL